MATDEQAAKQVAANGPVRAPVRLGERRADLRRLRRGDDPRPLRVGDDLPVVLPLPTDPGRGEHPPKRLRRPLTTGRRQHSRAIQVSRDRAKRLARQEPLSALLHHRSLRRAQRQLVGLVPVRPAAATRNLAAQRKLQVLPLDPLALMVALIPGQATQHTSRQPTRMRTKIYLARHRAKLEPQLIAAAR